MSQTDPRTDREQDPRLEGGDLAGLLFESNPQPAWIFDVATLRFLAVNTAATRCYGYAPDEFLQLSLREICVPEDLDALLAEVWQAAAEPPLLRQAGTRRHRRQDGVRIDVEVAWSRIVYAGRGAILSVITDVTAQRTAEAALWQSEDHLRAVVNRCAGRAVGDRPRGALHALRGPGAGRARPAPGRDRRTLHPRRVPRPPSHPGVPRACAGGRAAVGDDRRGTAGVRVVLRAAARRRADRGRVRRRHRRHGPQAGGGGAARERAEVPHHRGHASLRRVHLPGRPLPLRQRGPHRDHRLRARGDPAHRLLGPHPSRLARGGARAHGRAPGRPAGAGTVRGPHRPPGRAAPLARPARTRSSSTRAIGPRWERRSTSRTGGRRTRSTGTAAAWWRWWPPTSRWPRSCASWSTWWSASARRWWLRCCSCAAIGSTREPPRTCPGR